VIDHVIPCVHFPADTPAAVVNAPANLVTACAGCDDAKGAARPRRFARMPRGRGVPAKDLDAAMRRVRAAIRRRLPRTDYP
jgi:5-methylcytosine-specific restriction endonuclease McrA